MKKKLKLINQFSSALFILLIFYSSAFCQPPIVILPSSHLAAKNLDVKAIRQIIRDNFDLNDDSSPYSKAKIKIVYNKYASPDHLVIYLLDKKYYTFEIARIDLADEPFAKNVIQDYKLQDEDMEQKVANPMYASCPDESADMVFATCETGIPTAVQTIQNMSDIASEQGYNVETLMGADENEQAVYDWLSCDNLKLFIRIGHGSSQGILVDDGIVSYKYFENLSSSALNNKVLFFNSCQVLNSPLEPAIIGAGAQKFAGGKTNLTVGVAAQVLQCWFEDVTYNDASMTDSISRCNSQTPNAGTYAISGNGSDYLFGDETENAL
ncbi:MAG: hypothetical protein GY874_19320 [Desulfobacteraceae bacterium]|nr:hypothetical protein [Desulfobacteraceae bacterium]